MPRKILHITNWYPNKKNTLEGIFIYEQFRLFAKVSDSHLLHIQVREGKKLWEYEKITYSEDEEGHYLFTRLKSQKIIELLSSLLLFWGLWKSHYKRYELLHFHIAYPLLSYYFLWKRIIKMPLVISEHWSAYHYYFYMPKTTHKLERTKRIFRQKIPLISVSQALVRDIQNFAECEDFVSTIIPNVIDMDYFYDKNSFERGVVPRFFSVNEWREIKNPFSLLEGFLKLFEQGVDFELLLGGYGVLESQMRDFVSENKMEEKITFCGKMDKAQIAHALSKSDAYLFSSDYETFSVVSAQALCCGVPLIGPALEAIQEYAKEDALVALDTNNAEEWQDKLNYFILNRHNYNRKKIAQKANVYLNHKRIAKDYGAFIERIIKERK